MKSSHVHILNFCLLYYEVSFKMIPSEMYPLSLSNLLLAYGTTFAITIIYLCVCLNSNFIGILAERIDRCRHSILNLKIRCSFDQFKLSLIWRRSNGISLLIKFSWLWLTREAEHCLLIQSSHVWLRLWGRQTGSMSDSGKAAVRSYTKTCVAKLRFHRAFLEVTAFRQKPSYINGYL